jgi:uncharacterized protein (DUF2384 family)
MKLNSNPPSQMLAFLLDSRTYSRRHHCFKALSSTDDGREYRLSANLLELIHDISIISVDCWSSSDISNAMRPCDHLLSVSHFH